MTIPAPARESRIARDMIHPFHPMKLLFHRDRLSAVLQGEPTPAPISVEWDLSNTCPHDCPFCSFGTSESQGYRQQHWQHFPEARIPVLIREMATAGVRSVTLTGGGEPLMHPLAAQTMEGLTAAGIDWGLVTNGALLVGARAQAVARSARFVRVSLDAGSVETHQKIHRPNGATYDDILRHLQAVIERARTENMGPLVVGASFCVMDENYREIALCAADLEAIGADYLEVRPTYPTIWRGDGWAGGLTQYDAAVDALAQARAQFDRGRFRIIGLIDRFESLAQPVKDYPRCEIGPLTTVIGADGRMWHCCVQRGQSGFEVGNVILQDFAGAWAGAQRLKMAAAINLDHCPRCRYDNYNRVIAGLQADRLHVNFV